MPEVGELKQLERLSLAGSKVSDDGLKHLGGLSALRELDLSGTPVAGRRRRHARQGAAPVQGHRSGRWGKARKVVFGVPPDFAVKGALIKR